MLLLELKSLAELHGKFKLSGGGGCISIWRMLCDFLFDCQGKCSFTNKKREISKREKDKTMKSASELRSFKRFLN